MNYVQHVLQTDFKCFKSAVNDTCKGLSIDNHIFLRVGGTAHCILWFCLPQNLVKTLAKNLVQKLRPEAPGTMMRNRAIVVPAGDAMTRYCSMAC